MSFLADLTMLLLGLYVAILWWNNRGDFLFSPAGVQCAYLALYVALPTVVLHELEMPVNAGLGTAFYIENDCLTAIVLSLAGLIVGCLLAGQAAAHSVVPVDDLSSPSRQRMLQLLLAAAALLTLIFLAKNRENLSALTTVSSLFDPGRYDEIQEFKVQAMYGAFYLLQGLNQIIPFVALFLLAQSYRLGSRRKRRWAIALFTIDAVLLFATGALWVAFAGLLMAVLVRNYLKPPRRAELLAWMGGLVLIVLISYAYKRGATSLEDNNSHDQNLAIMGLLGERFSAGARQLQFVLDTFPQPSPYEYGFTYVRDAIGMIPSPVKRLFFREEYWGGYNGYIFYGMYGYFGGTAQIPLIGEFYSNFGMFGVFAGSTFYGYLLQRICRKLRGRSLNSITGVVFTITAGYRLAEATVEGLGDRFMVSVLWILILYLLLAWLSSPTAERRPLPLPAGDSPH